MASCSARHLCAWKQCRKPELCVESPFIWWISLQCEPISHSQVARERIPTLQNVQAFWPFNALRETSFETCSHRLMTKFVTILKSQPSNPDKQLLFIYSDGGPDHRLTYLSVQLSMFYIVHKRKCNFTCSDIIIMNNKSLPPALVVG